MRIIPFVVAAALSGTPGLPAPAPTGQTCLIRGEVLEVAVREVSRDPDWARSFGVTIRPI